MEEHHMPETSHSAAEMIAGMSPELQPETYVFVTATDPDLITRLSTTAIATFVEQEGLSLIVPVSAAKAESFDTDHPMRCITLNVYSALDGVGLTAAVAGALGQAGIPCNMVAAFHHDHVFLPAQMCEQALEVLRALQSGQAPTP
jgi:hypothetical protein